MGCSAAQLTCNWHEHRQQSSCGCEFWVGVYVFQAASNSMLLMFWRTGKMKIFAHPSEPKTLTFPSLLRNSIFITVPPGVSTSPFWQSTFHTAVRQLVDAACVLHNSFMASDGTFGAANVCPCLSAEDEWEWMWEVRWMLNSDLNPVLKGVLLSFLHGKSTESVFLRKKKSTSI